MVDQRKYGLIERIVNNIALNIITAIGFVIYAISLWTNGGSILWRLAVTALAVFWIMEVYRLITGRKR